MARRRFQFFSYPDTAHIPVGNLVSLTRGYGKMVRISRSLASLSLTLTTRFLRVRSDCLFFIEHASLDCLERKRADLPRQ